MHTVGLFVYLVKVLKNINKKKKLSEHSFYAQMRLENVEEVQITT